jgi:serine/threonine protein kinase
MADLIGQTLGQYRIEAVLGSGGMGMVYRGLHRYLNRRDAIKVMLAHLAENPDFRARFLQEGMTAAALKHPNVVDIYDFAEQQEYLYLVMELMTDGSLSALLRRMNGEPLPLQLGIDLARQAAEGLAAAQALQMIHRDIKPDNLLLNRMHTPGRAQEHYQLKISDFGLARLIESSGLTTTGTVAGTPAYMSPEQCQSKPLDSRSDIYSLGVVLYELAVGFRPFQIKDFAEAYNKHVNVPPTPPRQVRPDLPPAVEEVILRCIAKRPDDRYATAAELAIALHRTLGQVGNEPFIVPAPVIPAPPASPQRTTGEQPPDIGNSAPPKATTSPGAFESPRIQVLDRDGSTKQVVNIKKPGLIIGRQNDSDVFLSEQAISRQHLQVLWDGQQVMVKDLGSSNGSYLEGARLTPHISQPWLPQQKMRIGSYWLILERAGEAIDPTGQAARPTELYATSIAQQKQGVPSIVNSNRIGMSISAKTLSLVPGQPAMLRVTLTNLGNTVDWFTTTVEDVPPGWIKGTGQEAQLNPGMQEVVDLTISVAKTPDNLAQDYPITIRARSREKRHESNAVQAVWTVQPYHEETMQLEPFRVAGRVRAAFTVSLQNSGNVVEHYELSGEDDESKLQYQFASNPVNLEPGKKASVALQVRDRRHWIGREQRQSFQILAHPAGRSSPLDKRAEFVNKALLPGWLLTTVLLILLLAAGIVAYNVFLVKTTRMLTSTLSQSQTANASGTKQVPATTATGRLTVYANFNSQMSYPAGTVFTGKSGIPVVIDTDLNVPDSNSNPVVVSVSAHAQSAGSNGNIPAHDIDQSDFAGWSCSSFGASTLSVIIPTSITQGVGLSTTMRPDMPLSGGGYYVICNHQAFTGGQDAQTYSVVQQSDIDGAANSLMTQLTSSAQAALSAQMHSNEHVISPPQCKSSTASDHSAGDVTGQVTVTVTMTCTDEVSN